MTLATRALAWRYRLPSAQTHTVQVERDLRVPMDDGTVLLADRYGTPGAPVIMIRTPYGRRGPTELVCRLFAERGFQVLVQSTRGTFGSGGAFEPFVHERPDGLATIAWIVKQPWHAGKLGTFGPSYLGHTQWAVADAPEIMAMAAQVTAPSFEDHFYLGGAFALDDLLGWAVATELQERPLNLLRAPLTSRRIARLIDDLPLGELDAKVLGRSIPFYQGWLERDQDYWASIDHRDRTPSSPVHLTAGWYDLFLEVQLKDYAAQRAAGRQPYLTIGPWTHGSLESLAIAVNESLRWFRAHLLGEKLALRAQPVRIHVTGGGGWRDLPDWPPPATERRWYPAPGGSLSERAGESADRYRYDPANPTPSIGGPSLYGNARPVDNRPLETRSDVLVYSGPPLSADLEMIGVPRAELRVRSSVEHTDFFVRLCDVDASGVSKNVTEGVVRCEPGTFPRDEDGVMHVTVPLRAMAHRFARGHRMRFQVSSGSHPRIARNPGTGEPLATAERLVAADQEVRHSSCFIVP